MSSHRPSFPPAPSQARAVLIQGHPRRGSFSHALATAWTDGARQGGVHVDVIEVGQLDFDLVFRAEVDQEASLEPDLVRARQLIADAAHVVVAFPVWWSSTPAPLKGFIDRVFGAGWAYRYENHLPVGGLKGRSGRVLVTMDSPLWYDRWLGGRPAIQQVRRGTLAFCGLSPVGLSAFGSLHRSTPEQRERMLAEARRAGAKDASRLVRRFPVAQIEASEAA